MIEVAFLNVITGSSSVRRRVFESEGAYLQWLDGVRHMVEIVAVVPIAASSA